MKKFVVLLLLAVTTVSSYAQNVTLENHGKALQLHVDGRPFLILGGELGNSSAACDADIEANFDKLRRMGLNTVLVPAYWDLIEPVEGEFDYSLTDKVLEEARRNDLKVIFLWFGAWKNSMSCYAPLWFKQDFEKYPRAYTKEGKPLEIASAFSEEVFKADNKAFRSWLTHVAEADRGHGTVLMVQIENEIGMLEDARDHSEAADAFFNAPVPDELMSYLRKNRKDLHPYMKEKWSENGSKTKGTWTEVFGDDIYTDEIFMAWHYARYVERMALSAREIHDVPLYVNAAMNSRGRKPGEYPSAGPLAHLIDIWHAGAPTLDFIAPDLYDDGFKDWVAQYHLHNNPLFIPETKHMQNNGVRAFYVLGEHDAIGISPFAIEDGSAEQGTPFVEGYEKLREMMPLIAEWQGKDAMWGLLFDQQDKERVIVDGDLTLTCRHNFTLPWDPRATDGSVWPEGGGIIIRLAADEYIVAGNGIVVEFATTAEKTLATSQKALGEDGFVAAGTGAEASVEAARAWTAERCGIGFCDEVRVLPDASFEYVRRMNGDQDHQGRHVRISVGDYKVLHVKLYRYR
ncbi:MAG: hypothetical protein E7113_02690 [Bacteroidales bacterium]|nr:hypothetical protein [Bacteroidales bacterium]